MQAQTRQNRIEEYLQKVEVASLEELAKHVSASASTVRRDLTILEAAGNVQRTHGGARLVNPRSDEFAFSARDTHQLTEKEAIGRACAELIQPNQSVILDAGTTVFHVARYLEPKAPQIITNSHGLLIDIQLAMIKAAQKVIFCFDHTKLGRRSVSPLCGLDCVDVIVTDAGAPQELV